MVHVSPQPAAAHTGLVVQYRAIWYSRHCADQQRGEIHACIDRKLKRAPEPAVDLHDVRDIGSLVELVFDHAGSLEVEAAKQSHGVLEQLPIQRYALTIDA